MKADLDSIVSSMSPGKPDDAPRDPMDDLALAAGDFLKAVHGKDARGVAMAFRAMADICEAQPHDENDE